MAWRTRRVQESWQWVPWRAGWLQQEVPRGGRGVDEEEPFLGSELGTTPAPCVRVWMRVPARWTCTTRARAPSPFAVPSPCLELFLLPRSCPAPLLFFLVPFSTTPHAPTPCAAARDHHHHGPRPLDIGFSLGNSRPAQPWWTSGAPHQPCMPTAKLPSWAATTNPDLLLSTQSATDRDGRPQHGPRDTTTRLNRPPHRV